MTRLFHALAALVLGTAAALALTDRPVVLADPVAQVVSTAARSRLTLTERGRLPGGETVLRFSDPACPGSTTVLLSANLHRPLNRALGWMATQGSLEQVVYAGRALRSSAEITAPWLGRKLGEILRLRRKTVWDWTMLAAAAPIGCHRRPLDWTHVEDAPPAVGERRDPGTPTP